MTETIQGGQPRASSSEPPASSDPALRTLLITEWWPPYIGGSINYFVNTYLRYPPDHVHVLTGLPDEKAKGAPSPLPVTRVSLRRYPWLKPESLALYARLVRAAYRLQRQHRFAVVHCGHVYPEAMVAWMLKLRYGTPYVVYCHGEEVSIQRRQRSKRMLMPHLFNGARGVIANSENSRRILREVGVRDEKIHVINPGVDVDHFTPAAREADSEFRILSVGRLQARKGYDQVIRAVHRLRDEVPGLRYDIVGHGEELEALRRLADELSVSDRVCFRGVLEDDELPGAYQSCDAFVLANRHLGDDDHEGFGMVFLEAAACGKPVIGGRSGGTSDAVADGDNGMLVDTDQVEVVADAIRRLALDPELCARMGERGRQRVVDHFQWDDISRRIQELSRG